MAKALMGHLDTGVVVDPRRVRETLVLRRRVADLEAEVLRLKAENDALADAYSRDTDSRVPGHVADLEPVLS